MHLVPNLWYGIVRAESYTKPKSKQKNALPPSPPVWPKLKKLLCPFFILLPLDARLVSQSPESERKIVIFESLRSSEISGSILCWRLSHSNGLLLFSAAGYTRSVARCIQWTQLGRQLVKIRCSERWALGTTRTHTPMRVRGNIFQTLQQYLEWKWFGFRRIIKHFLKILCFLITSRRSGVFNDFIFHPPFAVRERESDVFAVVLCVRRLFIIKQMNVEWMTRIIFRAVIFAPYAMRKIWPRNGFGWMRNTNARNGARMEHPQN